MVEGEEIETLVEGHPDGGLGVRTLYAWIIDSKLLTKLLTVL